MLQLGGPATQWLKILAETEKRDRKIHLEGGGKAEYP